MEESDILHILQCITDVSTLVQWSIENNLTNHHAVVDRHFELLLQSFSNQSHLPSESSTTQYTQGFGKRKISDLYTVEETERKKYNLREKKRRVFKNRIAEEIIYDVSLNPQFDNEKLKDIMPQLKSIFQSMLKEVKPKTLKNTDLVRLYLSHPELHVPITVPPRQWSEISAEDLLQKLESVLTSKENLKVDEGFELHIGSISVPTASGRSPVVYTSGPSSCLKRKKGVVTVTSDDNLCLARSISICLAKLSDPTTYERMRNGRNNFQKDEAKSLQQKTGLPLDRPVSFNHIHLFEELIDYQIVVISSLIGNKPVYAGQPRDRRIYLYYSENNGEGHFDAIINIEGCLGVVKFCHRCLKGYSSRHR